VREIYTCDANGNLQVKISSDLTGYTRKFVIGQSTQNGSPLKPRPSARR
jgi:hypothetical protein